MSFKPTDTTIFKIRRKTDGKFLSADFTWSEENYAKLLFNNHSVTSILCGKKLLDTEWTDLEVVYYVCDPVYQQDAISWKDVSEIKFKKKLQRCKGLRNLIVAVILKGKVEYKDCEDVELKVDSRGWVNVDELITLLNPIVKDLTKELIKDVVILGKDDGFNSIVFNKEESNIKVVKPKNDMA